MKDVILTSMTLVIILIVWLFFWVAFSYELN